VFSLSWFLLLITSQSTSIRTNNDVHARRSFEHDPVVDLNSDVLWSLHLKLRVLDPISYAHSSGMRTALTMMILGDTQLTRTVGYTATASSLTRWICAAFVADHAIVGTPGSAGVGVAKGWKPDQQASVINAPLQAIQHQGLAWPDAKACLVAGGSNLRQRHSSLSQARPKVERIYSQNHTFHVRPRAKQHIQMDFDVYVEAALPFPVGYVVALEVSTGWSPERRCVAAARLDGAERPQVEVDGDGHRDARIVSERRQGLELVNQRCDGAGGVVPADRNPPAGSAEKSGGDGAKG